MLAGMHEAGVDALSDLHQNIFDAIRPRPRR